MSKQIKIPTVRGSIITVENPIVFELKAKQLSGSTIAFYKKYDKKPTYTLTQRRWYNYEETGDALNTLALIRALDGQKVKLTLEVEDK